MNDKIPPENSEHDGTKLQGILDLSDAFENPSQTDLRETSEKNLETKLIKLPDALDETFRNHPEDGQMTIRACRTRQN